jgi:hypothetical protein
LSQLLIALVLSFSTAFLTRTHACNNALASPRDVSADLTSQHGGLKAEEPHPSAFAFATTLSTVKPNFSRHTGPGAEAPKRSIETVSPLMLMPKGARHRQEAAQWMNWVYEPVEAARIAAAVQYISPVEGMREILAKNPATAALAGNPLMFPDAATRQRLHIFGPLGDQEEARWEERFAQITEG